MINKLGLTILDKMINFLDGRDIPASPKEIGDGIGITNNMASVYLDKYLEKHFIRDSYASYHLKNKKPIDGNGEIKKNIIKKLLKFFYLNDIDITGYGISYTSAELSLIKSLLKDIKQKF